MNTPANPLLTDTVLPAFGSIQPAHIEPAIRELLDANRAELKALLDSGAEGWDALVTCRSSACTTGLRALGRR